MSRSFNQDLLTQTLERDGAMLVAGTEFEKLTRNISIPFVCKCGTIYKRNFRLGVEKGGFRCKSCLNQKKQEKTSTTNIERYGSVCSLHGAEIDKKVKATWKEKYGAECPLQTPMVREKTRQTMLAKFGVENAQQADVVKKKKTKTCLEKYGVENAAQAESSKITARETNLVRYGTVSPTQNAVIQKKVRATTQLHYGVDNPFQSEEIKEQIKQNNLTLYGVENAAQRIDVQETNQQNAYKYKPFTMPSGTVRNVQGFEPFAIRDLLAAKYTEKQIVTDRKQIPRIRYILNEKEHYYFPDIYIPHENRIIEVKSEWTVQCNTECNESKKNACRAKGHVYEVWVYNRKGERIVS